MTGECVPALISLPRSSGWPRPATEATSTRSEPDGAHTSLAEAERYELRGASESSQDAAETLWRLERMHSNDRGIRNVDFSAWDMVRAAMLTRCGFALSWLTEDEAWDTLALLDRALRERYRNWTQVWESFWLTRWYWNSESGEGEHADDLHDLNRSLVLLGSHEEPLMRTTTAMSRGDPPGPRRRTELVRNRLLYPCLSTNISTALAALRWRVSARFASPIQRRYSFWCDEGRASSIFSAVAFSDSASASSAGIPACSLLILSPPNNQQTATRSKGSYTELVVDPAGFEPTTDAV